MRRGCPVPVALVLGIGCSSEPPIEANGRGAAVEDAGSEPSTSGDGRDAAIAATLTGSDLCPPTPARCDALGDERPDRLSEHSAAYDPDALVMLVFGGTPSVPVNCAPGEVEFLDELWAYDDPCGKWQRLEASGPSARGRHMATFGDGRMWLFGGRFRSGTSGFYQLYYDLWAFDPETLEWTEMPTAEQRPTARINGALVHDERGRRLWLMGGNQSENGAAYLPTNDVWSYSIDDQSWQQHNTSVGPAPRLFHAATFDPVRDRLVVFGGADETAFTGENGYMSDLWALDVETLEWQELAARLSGPNGRFWSQIGYDSEGDDYLLFAGHDDGVLGNRNDTWRFDLDSSEWSSLGSEDTHQTENRGVCDFPPDFAAVDQALPERRHSHTMVWSESCRHALLFAGKTDCGSIDDVWRWSLSGWTERSPAREGEACLRWREDPSECGDICF